MDSFSFLSDARQPWYSKDKDLDQYWEELQPLKRVVENGKAVRVEKLRRVPLPDELEVCRISNKSPCPYGISGNDRPQSNSKYKKSSRYGSPQTKKKTPSKISRPDSPKQPKKPLKCPLRIVELAAPTKRHCIETWRSKGYILPDFMMDRLRRYIMDETPIVQIPDAIKCFKRKKRIKPKRTKPYKTETQIAALKVLCGVFGFKIFELMNTKVPHTMPLNADLQRVCEVVTGEIINLMNSSKKNNIIKTRKRVISEISNRITVWIAIILQESTFKQLQEELYELEEEEGHILDFLDDVVANVLNICEPYPPKSGLDTFVWELTTASLTTSDGEFKQSGIEVADDHEISLKRGTAVDANEYINDLMNELLNTLDIANANENVIDLIDELINNLDIANAGDYVNDLMNELINTLDSSSSFFTNAEEQDDNREQTNDKDIMVFDRLNPSATFFDASDRNVGEENKDESIDKTALIGDKDTKLDSNQVSKVQSNVMEDIEDENDPGKDVSTVDSTSKDQLSEVQENVTDETSSRKVQFSHNEITEQPLEDIFDGKERTSRQTSENDSLIIGPVNEDLLILSDAHEVWPEQGTTPPLKITASVSKSITSLGRITEFDEASVVISSGALETEIEIAKPDQSEGMIEDKIIQEFELSTDNKTSGLESGTDENTLPVETTDENTLPVETTSDNTLPVETTDYNTLPVETTDENTLPFETTDENKLAVEKTDDNTLTVETTDDNTLPVETTDESTLPFETTDENSLPVEKTDDNTLPVETTDDNTLPVETTDDNTLPVETNDGNTLPVETTDENTLPVKTTDENTLPVETTETGIFDITEAAESSMKITEFENEENIIPLEIAESGLVKTNKIAIDVGVKVEATGHTQASIAEKPQNENELLHDTRFDYKVYLDSAPSWIRIGSGEPSEDGSMKTLVPQKIYESDVKDYRKWCQEIITVAAKLEKGYQWMDNVTSNIVYLKKKHAMSKHRGKYNPQAESRDWNKLKRSVDKDVVLWTKLCKKARDDMNKTKTDFLAKTAKYTHQCQCNKKTPRHIETTTSTALYVRNKQSINS